MKTVTKTLLIGIGATLATDIWSLLLKLFQVHSNGLFLVGNWITSRLSGSLHTRLAGQELWLGYVAHYCLGISFAFLLVLMYGKKWFQEPSVLKAFLFGLVTLVISLFIIQPVLGFGVAFAQMPHPIIINVKVVLFHLVYITGILVATQVIKNIHLTLEKAFR